MSTRRRGHSSLLQVSSWRAADTPDEEDPGTEKQDRASNEQGTPADLTDSAITSTAGEDTTTGVGGLLRVAEWLRAAPSASTAQADATITTVPRCTVISGCLRVHVWQT